jgi:hypothetical protein
MTFAVNAVDPKDPNEAKFYTFDGSPYLNTGATISSATWTCPGLTFANQTASGQSATAKISGGQHGEDYAIQLAITTSDGETIYPPRLMLRVRRADVPRSA